MKNAGKHFTANYRNLYQFFVEYALHFKSERLSLKGLLVRIHSEWFQEQLIHKMAEILLEKGESAGISPLNNFLKF